MEEIIGKGADFFLKCFKHQTPDEIPYMTPEELDVFLGSFAGLLEALAGIIKDTDPEEYRMMVNALEKVALK
tara:strand:- start:408 stop:623 length:216 start_codon:yes stop_codon:yes gene_type:complete